MRKQNVIVIAGLFTALLTTSSSPAANRKIAQTGFQFLSVGSDGRAAALAGAVTALEMKSGSLFFNPAGMANMPGVFDLAVSDHRFIADIRYNTLSLALRPFKGEYGVLGVSVLYVNYGDVQGTMISNSEAGYVKTEVLKPSAKAIGLGYAKALSDRFSVGGQVKYVRQDLTWSNVPVSSAVNADTTKTDNVLTPLAFDFGTQFKTGLKSLVFGMSIRNFSKEVKYAQEGFQLPLLFVMGISMDLMDFFPKTGLKQSLMMSVDATHDRSHSSKASEHLLVGLDYKLMDMLSVRGGYASGEDLSGFSFGIGLNRFGVSLDYAYTPYDYFDAVQRVTARISM
jgi:hypothetical protein